MKKVITDLDIDDLMSDWITRDGETFTHITKSGRLGWEKTLGEGSSLSDYFLPSDITKREVIKKGYSIANDLIVIMDPPKKVRIKLSTKGSCTDSTIVYVDTNVFDDTSIALGEQIDVFCGSAIHEGCHLCYTNFEKTIGLNKLEHQLFNIIEDERIEMLCGDLKPGLAGFLAKSKYYFFDQYFIDVIAPRKAEMEKSMSDLEKIFNLLLSIVRYPKYLDEETIVKYARFLIEIKKILVPYPDTTASAVKAAKDIYEIIKSLYVEEEKKEREEGSSGDGEESESSDGSKGSGKSGRSGSSDGSKDTRSTAEKLKDLLDKSSEVKDTRSKVDKESDEKKAEEKIREEAKKLSSKLEEHSIASDERKSGYDLKGSEELLKDSGLGALEVEGEVKFGSSEEAIFQRQDSDKYKYQYSYNRISRFIPGISRVLKGHCRDYKLVLRSMRSGVLDTTKLAEAIQGVPTVYLREGEVYTDKIAVVILIDESGSMCYSGRIEAARDTAVLLNESLRNIPDVELFIYGHTADEHFSGATELNVYRDKNYKPRYSLGKVSARKENRDGIAILEVAKEVRKQTTNDVVMFILSDGAPAARDYYGKESMQDVKSKVTQVEKMGFSVVQVCINASYDPKEMFKHFVILEDMSKLAFELGKVLKKAIMGAAKVHTKY